ncbi:MAG: hypothetical protein SGJ24_20220 [Chloroflexota bacterium]|nr:hypothetical protein [Chloroflexota bacterium]
MIRRSRVGWVVAATAILALVIGVAAARWIDPSRAAIDLEIETMQWVEVALPDSDRTVNQTFAITAFTYQRTPYSLGEMRVRVVNVTTTHQEGWVWTLLAPPDAIEAWREAVYTAPEQRIILAAGASKELVFAAPAVAPIPSGDYRLSAWVHGTRAGERFHSDGAGAQTTQYMGAPFSFTLANVVHAEQIDGSIALDVTMMAENHSGTPLEALLTFTVIALNTLTSDESGLPSYVHPGTTIRLRDGDRTATTLQGEMRLTPGRYRVIAWLRRQDGESLIRIVAENVISVQ